MILRPEEMELMWNFRKVCSNQGSVEMTESLIDAMRRTESNEDLIRAMPQIFPESRGKYNGG